MLLSLFKFPDVAPEPYVPLLPALPMPIEEQAESRVTMDKISRPFISFSFAVISHARSSAAGSISISL